MKRWLCVLFLLWNVMTVASSQVVFPTPGRLDLKEGVLLLGPEVSMCAEDTAAFHLTLFQEHILQGTPVKWRKKAAKADVCWVRDAALPVDAYRISITPRRMTIAASSDGGFVYAVQTLRQWAMDSVGRTAFACVEMVDAPRVAWRSFLLDSGRQYQKVATIKKYIDMLSLLKMNRFHWHLTEGLGWRIEIKQYPRLTQIGSRVGMGEEQQGFYTQEEIRELVEYARLRNVTIVPEIDMPGHAEAALAAYPELGCFGTPVEVPKQGFTPNIFCAGKDSTLHFLKNVLDEVCALFPSAHIHLGGDEAPKDHWNKCADCRRRLTGQGLKNSHDLQLWFSAEMANHLKAKGRRAIFWGDVLYSDDYPLPDNVVIHWWNYRGRRELALRTALKHNHPVICGSNYYTYLNFPVTPWRGYDRVRTFDLRDVYLNNPSDKVLQEENPLLLGMSCALWTDDGVTERMIDRRLFPRILALAEQMWHSGALPGFEEFHRNVLQRRNWFEQQGYTFGPALREEVGEDYCWE